MAIRPVDLQLAYLAAPQNAATLSSSQNAPAAAQQAAAAAFAAEFTAREEQIEQPAKVQGAKVQARQDHEHAGDRQRRQRRGTPYQDESELPLQLEKGGDGEHLIDVTA